MTTDDIYLISMLPLTITLYLLKIKEEVFIRRNMDSGINGMDGIAKKPFPITNALAGANDEADDLMNKDILELMGAKDMSGEQQAELYKKMMETIDTRVTMKIEDLLSDEDLDKLFELTKERNADEVVAFLTQRNVDIKKIYLDEVVLYKAEMAELAKVMNGAEE